MTTAVALETKACLGCGAVKPLAEYYRNKAGLGGRQSRCKPCFRLQLRATPDARKKMDARNAVRLAIKAGKMTRPDRCSACGAVGDVHGHHDDYSKRLDVRWLCPPCHTDAHRGDTYKARG